MKVALYSGNNFSETFTKAHLQYLKPDWAISGEPFPDTVNGRSILSRDLFTKVKVKFKSSFSKSYDPLKEEFTAFLQNVKPDVMFVEYGTSGLTVLDACRKANIPLCVGFYGYDVFLKKVRANYTNAYRELFQYGSFFLAQSESIKVDLVNMGCDDTKIIVNACPPVDDFMDFTATLDTKNVLCVGRFVDKKAPYLSLLAFTEVLKKHPNARLIMAGDGPLWQCTRELASYYGISDKVDFLGVIDRAKQIELFKSTAVFIQHSIEAQNGDREGAPVVVMEAGMAGIPVVSTLHSGIPEVVLDQQTGFLVKERDVKDMADKISLLLDDRKLATEMGKKAKSFVSDKFNMTSHINGLKKMLQDASLKK
jgi:colanic acid/amylovoran biosynthesis glycosyltransferase